MSNPEYMIGYYSRIPGFKQCLNEIQKQVTKNIASEYKIWGDKLFIPWALYVEIIGHYCPLMGGGTIAMLFPCVLWNFCKSRYQFSGEIFKLITESASDKIPINVFLNLREWSIHIDLKKCGLSLNGKDILSATLCLSDVNRPATAREEFTILIILGLRAETKRSFYNLTIPMVSDSIEECLKISDKDYELITGLDDVELVFGRKAPTEQRIDVFKKILNLYLYIQCENSTIINKNLSSIKYNPIRKTNRIFSPRDVKTWLIQSKDKFKGARDIHKTSTAIKPHVRRGHFHGYWVGPRDNPLDLLIKWIPPIYVNASKVTECSTE